MIWILVVIALLLLITFVYHKIMLKIENKYTGIENAPGIVVDVNGHKMHVYTEGQGQKTLVFMAGWGESSPYIEFKPLYSKLSDKFKIVVIEKAGYGFSETTDVSRDLNTLLFETRTAISKAGIVGPFVLVPHSLSGVEAVYWASQYPDEVDAIVAIDIATADYYEKTYQYFSNDTIMGKISDGLSSLAVTCGLHRLPFVYNMLNKEGITEEEFNLRKYMWFKNANNKTVKNENKNIVSNAFILKECDIPKDVPILTFISLEMQKSYNGWEETLINFTKQFATHEYYSLDSSHMIHNDKPEFMTEKIINFLENK